MATLKSWLQSKNLKFNGREKKDDLVKRVVQYVEETGTVFKA